MKTKIEYLNEASQKAGYQDWAQANFQVDSLASLSSVVTPIVESAMEEYASQFKAGDVSKTVSLRCVGCGKQTMETDFMGCCSHECLKRCIGSGLRLFLEYRKQSKTKQMNDMEEVKQNTTAMKTHAAKPIDMTNEQFTKVLPSFMRDFHDQKDLFKSIQSHYGNILETENKIPNNWIDNHVYVIDFFLWFMAQHGYRLTKFKSNKFTQYNIQKFITDFKDRQSDQFRIIISDVLPPKSQDNSKQDNTNN